MFSKSAVERELLRQTSERGTSDPAPEEVVDAAAAKVSKLQQTEDLYSDLMSFASNLRKRGFSKYAADIETNAFVFKQAEVHLYRAHDEDGEDILEFAHPGKDLSVGEAQGGLADVETLLTQHKKILDVVRKDPSGKLASLASDIVKSAQELSNPESENFQEVINQYWNIIKQNQPKILDALGLTVDSGGGVPIFHFTEDRVLSGKYPESYLKLYAELSNVKLDVLFNYLKLKKQVYKGKPESPQVIKESLLQDPGMVASLVSMVGSDPRNPDGSLNEGQLGFFAEALHGKLSSMKRSILTEGTIDLANKALKIKIAGMLNFLGGMDYSKPPLLEKNDPKAFNAALTKVNKDIMAIDKFVDGPFKEIRSLSQNVFLSSPQSFSAAMIIFRGNLKKLQLFLRANHPAKLDQEVPEWWSANVTANRYKEAGVLWRTYANSLPESDADRAIAERNAAKNEALSAIVSGSKSFVEMYERIAPSLPDLKSYYNIDQHSMKSLEMAQEYAGTKQASAINDLVKIAQVAGMETPQKKIKPSQDKKPEPVKPTSKPDVGAGSEKPKPQTVPKGQIVSERPTKEEFQYVSLMQTVLANFATALTEKRQELAEKLTNDKNPSYRTTEQELSRWAAAFQDTSEKPLGRYDGKWGGKTRGAIDYVNVIKARAMTSGKFNQAQLASLNLIQDMHWTKNKPEEVIVAAKTNIDSIQKLMRLLEADKYISSEVQKASPQDGKSDSTVEVLDVLPANLNESNWKSSQEKQGVALRNVDLSSLRNLYMVLRNLKVYGASGEPMSIVTVEAALYWLMSRARWQLSLAQTQEPSNITLANSKNQYISLTEQLVREWDSIKGKFTDGIVVPDKRLDVSLSGDSGRKDIGSGKERRSPGRGGDFTIPKSDKADEPNDIRRLESLMLGRQIDLVELAENSGDSASAEIYSKFLTAPIMSLDRAQHFNPASFWQIFMPQEMQARFVENNRHPTAFARMMEQYIRNTINTAYNQIYKIVREKLPGKGAETREKLQEFLADQGKLRDNWISKLATLRENAINWGSNSPEIRPWEKGK